MQLKQLNTIEQYSNIDSKYFVGTNGTVFTSRGDKLKKLKIKESESNKTLRVGILDKEGKRVYKKIADIVAHAFCTKYKDIENKLEYIDGNKRNLDYSNLQWTIDGTPAEEMLKLEKEAEEIIPTLAQEQILKMAKYEYVDTLRSKKIPTITDEIADKWVEEFEDEMERVEAEPGTLVLVSNALGTVSLKFDIDLVPLDQHIADVMIIAKTLEEFNKPYVDPRYKMMLNLALFELTDDIQACDIDYM